MRVFVTGNAGKLGHRIERLLLGSGHKVIGFDVANDSRQDICDLDATLAAMRAAEPEVVVHCAGIPHPNKGGFGRYMQINVVGSANVAEAAERVGVRRLVYLSSTGFYGCDTTGWLSPAYFPIDEAHPIASRPGRSRGGLSAYNQSKVMVEQILAWYGTRQMMETVALRLAPANAKAWQYKGKATWQDYCQDYCAHGDNWVRGCLFSNCHPDYGAQAALLAVEAEGPFWYEPFNVLDRYTHGSIDVHEFLEQEYPDVPVRGDLGAHDSLISPQKAVDVLGFEPCEELE